MAIAASRRGKTVKRGSKREFTDEEKAEYREQKIAEQRELMQNALNTLASSDMWSNWIKFGRSNLRKYSFGNALLIWSQKRDATLVHGYKQWQKEGVQVQKGAKALSIFAPMFFKATDKNGNEIIGANGEPEKRIFFRVVKVFDVSDTDAPPVDSSLFVKLDGDEHSDKMNKLETFALDSLGITVEYSDIAADGMFNKAEQTIVINKSLSINHIVHTLVHELCHAYGDVNYKDYTREEAEVLVESATVMALSMLDFDVSATSVPYIASWGGDLKVLDKYAKLVDELVGVIVDAMEVK